jgi:hypothetical protein
MDMFLYISPRDFAKALLYVTHDHCVGLEKFFKVFQEKI